MVVDLCLALIVFILFASIRYIVCMRKIKIGASKKKRKKDAKEIIEVKYLMLTYKLKKEKLLTKKIILIISLIDAFIIALTFLIIMVIPLPVLWQLLIGFLLLFGLIYAITNIFGRILVKKGYDK